MKVALLFAHWRKYGEKFCTPENWEQEFISREHEVDIYNLYHADGQLGPNNIRRYSNEGFNTLVNLVRNGDKEYDLIKVLDYGPWQNINLNKKTFPNSILVREAGDEPQAHQLHKQTSHLFDLVLTPDLRCSHVYKNVGVKAIWQPHFADTRWFFPRNDISIEYDAVTTTGPRGNGLTEKIKKALGNQFENSRYYFGHQHGEQLSRGKIVFHKSQFGEIGRRIFEGMASHRMVLTDRLDISTGLCTLFKEGEEIVFYDDADDAIDKIRYYASHDAEREAIAEAGYQKVITHHTIKNRMDELLEAIK